MENENVTKMLMPDRIINGEGGGEATKANKYARKRCSF